jgi:hypothetical protein
MLAYPGPNCSSDCIRRGEQLGSRIDYRHTGDYRLQHDCDLAALRDGHLDADIHTHGYRREGLKTTQGGREKPVEVVEVVHLLVDGGSYHES